MKYTLALFFVLFNLISFSQTKDPLKKRSGKTSEVATFIATLDIAKATKDGIYLNGYVVNIDYAQAKRLDGKKIKVTGKVTIVKGVKRLPNAPIEQGREGDTKYIESPKVEIVNG